METNEHIDSAISAHIEWFSRIRRAIITGESTFDPKVVGSDNACPFSKWLYGEFKQVHGREPIFEEICQLHARFHQLAGFILERAMTGRNEEVKKLMDFSGEFNQLSGKLILKLISVKDQ